MADNSMALQVQQPQFMTPADVGNFQNMLYKQQLQGLELQQAQQQAQQKNALMSIMKQPDAIGDDGMPTKNALKQIYAVNPEAGMTMQSNMAKMQEQQRMAYTAGIRQKKEELELDDHQMNHFYVLAKKYDDMFDQVKDMPGSNSEQALQAVNAERKKDYEELSKSGDYKPQQLAHLLRPFDAKANDLFVKYAPDAIKERIEAHKENKADSAEGKIEQDYDKGVFGKVGSQEAMARRDKALEKKDAIKINVGGEEKSKYTNIQQQADGTFIGMNKKSGKIEKIPTDEGVTGKEQRSTWANEARQAYAAEFPLGTMSKGAPNLQDYTEKYIQKKEGKSAPATDTTAVKVTSKAEFDKLPKGAKFIDARDGKTKIKG